MDVIKAALLLVLFASPLHAKTLLDRAPPTRFPSLMTSTEIAAFNVGLEFTHPYFIKCRKIQITGSLFKKARVCRTNEAWVKASSIGNQDARDTVEAMRKGSSSSN